MEKIILFEAFSGYGGASFALEKAKIDYECIGYSEIDKNGIKCYDNNFPGIKNFGDISKIEPSDLQDFNLLTGGFPCQDVSIAGKRDLSKGRTLLIEHIFRIVAMKKPKYLLLENVKGLLSMPNLFNSIKYTLHKLGYGVEWRVLNSKEHGIPQNRERVWLVCKLGGWGFGEFMFPVKKKLNLTIKDILEKEVDKKYYLSDKVINTIMKRNHKKFDGIAPSMCKSMHKLNESTPIVKNKPIHMANLNIISNKRVFDTLKEINEFLRKHKLSFTIKEIADHLDIKKTKVEHFFRLDNSRTIPNKENWFKLKNLLKFDNTYDKEIVTIEKKVVEFEQSRRIYNSNGVSPCLNTVSEPLIGDYRNDEGLRIRKDNCSPSLMARARNDIFGPPIIHQTAHTKANGKRYKNDGCSFTLEAVGSSSQVIENKNQWRRLTPKECFRLMGFLNDEINLKDLSDTAKYKLAGNGWDINVASLIFKNMFKGLRKW